MISRIKAWFNGTQAVPAAKLQIIRIESQKTTLAQWRSQNSAVGGSIELAQNPVYRAQRDILESQHPRHVILKMGMTETDRLVHQARIEGYQWALITMDLFVVPLKQKREVEATFEPPEQNG